MLNCKEIEKYWIDSSDDDFEVSEKLFENKKYMQSMFFLHLAIEKLLKGLFVNRNKIEANRGHNLQTLIKKIEGIEVNEERLEILSKITLFNIAARYDDYKRNFYKSCNEEFAGYYINIAKEQIKWLKSQFKY